MAIVRELLIRLGFQTDKKAINETNRAITGFKTRFAVAATAATYAFKVIKDFFNDIAAATLDSDELARSLGISLNELVALQQAAQNFRIKPEQFAGVLSMLQKDLNEFVQGFGRLPELARQIGIEISRDTTSLQLFDMIIEKIRTIENEQERIRIASAIFGDQLGTRISDLSQDFDGFRDSVARAYEELEKTPDVTPQLREYEKALNSISNSLYNLFRTIVVELAPAVQKLAEWLDIVVRLSSSLLSFGLDRIKSVGREGWDFLAGTAGAIGDKISSGWKSFKDWLTPYVTYDPNAPRAAPQMSTGPNWIESQLPASWVNYINNSVDVNVPQGTSQEQATFLGEQIDRMVEDSIMNTFYQIQNNNPVVE